MGKVVCLTRTEYDALRAERDALAARVKDLEAGNERLLTLCHLSSGSSAVKCGECGACLRVALKAEQEARRQLEAAWEAQRGELTARIAEEQEAHRATKQALAGTDKAFHHEQRARLAAEARASRLAAALEKLLESLGEYVRQSMDQNPEWSAGVRKARAALTDSAAEAPKCEWCAAEFSCFNGSKPCCKRSES